MTQFIAMKSWLRLTPSRKTILAAAGDQTAKPLEEAKHGMFSYFLMKGMEGEADANNDNEITAGELHSYVRPMSYSNHQVHRHLSCKVMQI